jgi:hypothetical protein
MVPELTGAAGRSRVSQYRIEEKTWAYSAKKSRRWTTCFGTA